MARKIFLFWSFLALEHHLVILITLLITLFSSLLFSSLLFSSLLFSSLLFSGILNIMRNICVFYPFYSLLLHVFLMYYNVFITEVRLPGIRCTPYSKNVVGLKDVDDTTEKRLGINC